jgi:hypothetical protein
MQGHNWARITDQEAHSTTAGWNLRNFAQTPSVRTKKSPSSSRPYYCLTATTRMMSPHERQNQQKNHSYELEPDLYALILICVLIAKFCYCSSFIRPSGPSKVGRWVSAKSHGAFRESHGFRELIWKISWTSEAQASNQCDWPWTVKPLIC